MNKFRHKICNERIEDKRFQEFLKASSAERNKMFCEALRKIDELEEKTK